MATFPKPVVGAVNGPALAGGCGLASACDVLLAAPQATFGYPEVRIGFVAAMVLVFLSRQLGERLARELLLTGRTMTAEEAREAGLVHRVIESDRLTEEAVAFAENLTSGAPASLALTKELLWHTSGLPAGCALSLAETVNVFARTTPDMQEGLSAFFGKRRPSWPES
jgi:methylglutaconyl-CoA hydratase